MSLEATIVSAIDTAFAAAGDLVGSFTLRKTDSSFDPSNADTTLTTVDYIVTGVFEKVDDSILEPADIKDNMRDLWVLSKDALPEIDDKIIDASGKEFTIMPVMPIKAYDKAFLYKVRIKG